MRHTNFHEPPHASEQSIAQAEMSSAEPSIVIENDVK
jgi:hypothetical protein